jgi:hypothetical protein
MDPEVSLTTLEIVNHDRIIFIVQATICGVMIVIYNSKMFIVEATDVGRKKKLPQNRDELVKLSDE